MSLENDVSMVKKIIEDNKVSGQYSINDVQQQLFVSAAWIRKMEGLFPDVYALRDTSAFKPVYYGQKAFDMLYVIRVLRLAGYSIAQIQDIIKSKDVLNNNIIKQIDNSQELFMNYNEVARRYTKTI